MKKKAIIGLLLLLFMQRGMGQLYDLNWIVGDSARIFTFRNDSIIKNIVPKLINNADFWACISDENGHFQFFTEGYDMYDSLGNRLQNGYDLVDSIFEAWYPGGWQNTSGGVILPRGNGKYYYINHSASNSLMADSNFVYPNRLYYAEIDMNANGGQGSVTSKRNMLYGQPMCNTHITACRHANGRDWWVVVNNFLDSVYAKFLVTPDTITGPFLQGIGPGYPNPNIAGQLQFSPDGSKMAGTTSESQLVIMDFDRCSGLFSDPVSFYLPNDTFMYFGSPYIVGGGGISVMFSSSGRYLYVSRQEDLLQYDLEAADIAASEQVIYYLDSFHNGQLAWGYLTPNGTILIANINFTHNGFNIIMDPEQPGRLCNFIKEDTDLFVYNDIFINQTFNYRLGALIGSGCDTISDIRQAGANSLKVRLYPNPATDMTQLDLYTRDLNEPLSFVVYDMVGKEIMRKNIPLYQIQVSRNGVASGIYNWQVQNAKGQAKAAGKLVWE